MALAEPPRTDEPHRWCEWSPAEGSTRLGLVFDIASGEYTEPQLAARYDCTVSNIAQWKVRLADQIEEAREAVRVAQHDELAGYWGARKAARIAHRMQVVEDCEDRIVDGDLPVNELSALNKDKLRALHDIAEETTGLLTRSQVALGSDQSFRVEVVGVDMERALSGLSDDQPARASANRTTAAAKVRADTSAAVGKREDGERWVCSASGGFRRPRSVPQ